jgi:hypothetical protein
MRSKITHSIAITSCFIFCAVNFIQAQRMVYETFNDRRVINSQSVEMLPGRKLDFRVGHRFGDVMGSSGGWNTFFGIENSSDILIGFDYGVSDHINIGISRTKGSDELRQNINTFFKARLMQQQIQGRNPLTIGFVAQSSISTMQKSNSEGVLSSFPETNHRISYHLQLMVARKIGKVFSIQGNASWTYRNLVYNYDQNDLVSLGIASRLSLTRALGLVVDTNFPISNLRTSENGYYPSLGVGFEFGTGGGHVFQLNFTNSTGMSETDYIPYTRSDWTAGEFRIGFTISRIFNM